jgi:hypothetical protein
MFRKLLERLETLVEPQIDSSQFVSHYSPPVEYKNKKEQISYAFTIDEETHLGEQITKNSYELAISVEFNYTSNKLYYFDVKTSNVKLKLDKRLVQQEKLLEDLSKLTEDVSLTVNENGTIESFDYPKLSKKWDVLKVQLLKKHKGKQVESYIEGIDKRIKNESLFLERFKDPRFYGLLFDGLQTLHKKSRLRKRKMSRVLHTFPSKFEESVEDVIDKDGTRHFSLKGKMLDLSSEAQNRIKDYLSYFDVEQQIPYLLFYKKNADIDLQNGYLKNSSLELEITNGQGYIRRQFFQLKQNNNG